MAENQRKFSEYVALLNNALEKNKKALPDIVYQHINGKSSLWLGSCDFEGQSFIAKGGNKKVVKGQICQQIYEWIEEQQGDEGSVVTSSDRSHKPVHRGCRGMMSKVRRSRRFKEKLMKLNGVVWKVCNICRTDPSSTEGFYFPRHNFCSVCGNALEEIELKREGYHVGGVKSEYWGSEEPKYRNVQVWGKAKSEKVEAVLKSDNSDNWSSAIYKVDTDRSVDSKSSKVATTTFTKEKKPVNVNGDNDRLHRKVAHTVMKNLNKYYPGSEEFDPSQPKIGNSKEYARLATQFSHSLRNKIEESFEAYNLTLEGIELTGDHELYIRTEIESHFETVSRI